MFCRVQLLLLISDDVFRYKRPICPDIKLIDFGNATWPFFSFSWTIFHFPPFLFQQRCFFLLNFLDQMAISSSWSHGFLNRYEDEHHSSVINTRQYRGPEVGCLAGLCPETKLHCRSVGLLVDFWIFGLVVGWIFGDILWNVFFGEGNLWKLPAYLLDAEMCPYSCLDCDWEAELSPPATIDGSCHWLPEGDLGLVPSVWMEGD